MVVDRDGQTISTTATLDDVEGSGLLGVSYSDVVVEDVSVLGLVPAAAEEFWDLGYASVTGVIGFFSPSNLVDFVDRVISPPGSGVLASCGAYVIISAAQPAGVAK